jgi:hypothetical protein
MKNILILFIIGVFVVFFNSCDPPFPRYGVTNITGNFTVSPNVPDVKVNDTIFFYFEKDNLFKIDSNTTQEINDGRLNVGFNVRYKDKTEDWSIASLADCKYYIKKGNADIGGPYNTINGISATFEHGKYKIEIGIIPQRIDTFWVETHSGGFHSDGYKFNAYTNIGFEGNNQHHDLIAFLPFINGDLQGDIARKKRTYAFSVK